MLWTKAICGYKDFRPRYSTDVVFNNFPWSEVSQKDKKNIEKTAKKIKEVRSNYPESSLADLYDVNTMPDDLRKAHIENDKAVMAAYGFTGKSDEEVTKALLQLYKKLTKNE